MQSGKDPSLQKSLSDNDCKLDFAFSLIIPDNYLPDVGLNYAAINKSLMLKMMINLIK